MKPLVTIFTPTFNRANLLTRLYNSLTRQLNTNFEWLIVDDGSTDNTSELINEYKEQKLITIRYYKQENGGKHTAINKGICLAEGELFFIVDSDDFLPNDSLMKISHYYKKIKENSNIAGIVGKRYIENENISNIQFEKHEIESTLFDIRYKKNYEGDMAEIVKTSIMRKYFFPVFENEKFCTEALVWNRMSKCYKFLFINEFIYNGEYQDGGLTSKYWQLLLNNPKSSLLYYKELLSHPLNKKQRKQTLKAYNNIAKINGYSKFQILKEIGINNYIKIFI